MTKNTNSTGRSIRVSQSNWLNLLPDIHNMDVLKIGTKRTDNIITISFSKPKTLSCIGASVYNVNNVVDNFYNNIEDVLNCTFDFIILDESEYITSLKSFNDIKIMLSKISQLLRDKGIFLLCFPDGRAELKYRYWVQKALSLSGFINKSYYFCDPSTENPLTILPYSADTKWEIEGWPDFNEKPFSFKLMFKEYLKNILFHLTKTYNPFRGLIVVTDKLIVNESNILSLFNRYFKNKIDLVKYEDLVMTCVTGYHLMKHYMFFYRRANNELYLIVKVGFRSPFPVDDLRREFNNLSMISDYKEIFKEREINVVDYVHYKHDLEKSLLIQSAVPGKTLSSILEKYKHKNKKIEILEILESLTDIQITIQDICSQNLIKSVGTINVDYFTNYTSIPLVCEQPSQSSYLNYIQHGDFTANNILLDMGSKKWGVIDWEWLSIGFPPLFDLFSFFTSIRFMNSKLTNYNQVDGYYISFKQTYFEKNWFSECLVVLVEKYCNYYHLSKDNTYNYFIAFILFHCNKYRIHKLPLFQKLYERMLMFAINNKVSFIFNQSTQKD